MAIRVVMNSPTNEEEYDIVGLTEKEASALAAILIHVNDVTPGSGVAYSHRPDFIYEILTNLGDNGISWFEFRGQVTGNIEIDLTEGRRLV